MHERSSITQTFTVMIALLIGIVMLLGARQALSMLSSGTSFSFLSRTTLSPLPKDETGYTNILLLGEGNSDHDGIDLTDTIMIASIDSTRTQSTVFLSIPRDLYLLKTEKMGGGRINTLYRNYKSRLISQGQSKDDASNNALNALMQELGNRLNLTMHGVVKLNFSGFEQAIDAIGGIDIDVPETIIDTEYPGVGDSFITFSVQEGPQHFDGATALKYARSRHTTSDFSRSARQQDIIVAAVKKVKENGFIENLSNISRLLRILSNNVESTFSLQEMLSLAYAARSLDAAKTVSLHLSDRNGLYGTFVEPGGLLYAPPRSEFEGASVLLPIVQAGTSIGSWKQLALFSDLTMKHRTWFAPPAPGIAILNAGAAPGTARSLAIELIRYGFNVVDIGNFEEKNLATSSIRFQSSAGEKSEQAHRASVVQELATFLSSTLTVDDIAPESTRLREHAPDIVIVLGKDFTFSPLSILLSKKEE